MTTNTHTHTEIHPEQLAGWRHEFRADPFLLVMVAKFELENLPGQTHLVTLSYHQS